MNRLFEKFETECQVLDRTSTSTPSGPQYTWSDGAKFMAAVVKNSTLAARVAEKQGVTEVYTVTARPGVELNYNDVFKRLSDGAVFRVTSNFVDSKTPTVSTFRFSQVSAERWEIPR